MIPTIDQLMFLADTLSRTDTERRIPTGNLYRDITNTAWLKARAALRDGLEAALCASPVASSIDRGELSYQDFATAEQHWIAANMRNGVTAGEYAAAMRKIIDAAYASGKDAGRAQSLEGGV